jgi:hypothetical protein
MLLVNISTFVVSTRCKQVHASRFAPTRYMVDLLQVLYLRNKSWKPECVGSFNMGWRILVFYPEPGARDQIY